MPEQWFYAINNERKGPVDFGTLQTLATNKIITKTTLVWKEGLKEWVPASRVQGLCPADAQMPPPLPPMSPVLPTQPVAASVAATNSSAPSPLLPLIFLAVPLALWVLSAMAFVAGHVTPSKIIGGIGIWVCVATLVFNAIFIYRSWLCLPNEFRSTTPGKAVALLFVPMFNFYWVFTAIRGLTNDTNKAMQARGLSHVASSDLAIAACIAFSGSVAVFWTPLGIRWGMVAWAGASVVFGLWLVAQSNATHQLLAQPYPNAKMKLWNIGLYVCAGAFALCLILDSRFSGGGQGYDAAQETPQYYNSPAQREIGLPVSRDLDRSGTCTVCGGSGIQRFACPACGGTGKSNGFACSSCNGRGFSKCPRCRGTGRQ